MSKASLHSLPHKLPRTLLYVHSSDEMYGADLILLQLLNGLDRQRFRPVVVIPTDVRYRGLLTDALRERSIRVIHLKTAILRRKYFTPTGMLAYLVRLAASTSALARIIRREGVELVHSNTSAVIPGALAAQLTGVPHVWHVHEIIVRPRSLWRLTSWLLPRLSDQVVAVSGPTRAHLVAGDRRNAEKCTVIHNGIELGRFNDVQGCGLAIRREWNIAPEQPLVGMVGRISHWKGQDYFLRVAQIVLESHPEARFALVGGVFPGQESLLEDLRQLTAGLGIAPAVIFSPFRRDIPAVLDALDVFVLPSTLPDPFPTVVLEAMAARRPVIANAHGGSLEMVADGQTGWLVPPGKPEAMAAAIQHLLEKSVQRRQMGDTGRQRLEQYFSLEAFIQNWISLYIRLLEAS